MGWRGRRVQRQLAGYYALAHACFFLGSLTFLLNRSGVVNIHLMNPNALAWGLVLELVLVSVLLTARFRQAQRQNTYQRLRRLHERAAAGQHLIAAQDEVREALAPGFTALHLAWQGRAVREALAQGPPALAEAHAHSVAQLRQLHYDVRTLSQALLPAPPGEPLPLPDAVTLLTNTLSLTDEGPLVVTSRCDAAAATLPLAVQQAACRIVAEMLHNALCLTVEDDGRGFDPLAPLPPSGGLGLRGVQARAGYPRGQVQVRSQPSQGTSITVELPI